MAREVEVPGTHPPREVDQPYQRQRRHALARSRLADAAHDLTRIDAEIDAVDGYKGRRFGAEFDGEVFDFEQRHRTFIARV